MRLLTEEEVLEEVKSRRGEEDLPEEERSRRPDWERDAIERGHNSEREPGREVM
jgi:hypothetical protein